MAYPESTESLVGRESDDQLLLEFVAKEEHLLRQLGEIASTYPESGLRLLALDGRSFWSSSSGAWDKGQTIELDLHSIPGRLQFRPPDEWDETMARVWAETIRPLLDTVAGMSGEMSGLIDEHIALTDQLLAMFNIARGTRGHWDLGAQLKVVVHEAVRVTGMDAGVLWFLGSSGTRYVVHPEEPELLELAKKMTTDCAFSDQPEPNMVREISQGRFQACVTGEFQAGSGRRGRIALLTRRADRPILARDTKLAQALSDLAGTFAETASLQELAVENFKIARELEIARSIQRLLVPNVLRPTEEHEIAAYYEPARDVGGDFYIAQTLPQDQLLFAVGDVAGKGVPAALLMSMTRTAVMTLAGEVSSPAMVLRRVAQILYSDLDRTEKMVTLVLAYYSPSTASVAVANAGHSPVFIASETGKLISIEPTAPPLGVGPILEVKDQLYSFRKGDLLVAMSDGFSEARNEKAEFFGVSRLAEIIDQVKGHSAEEILQHVVQEVSSFVGDAPQADDQTLLILKGSDR